MDVFVGFGGWGWVGIGRVCEGGFRRLVRL